MTHNKTLKERRYPIILTVTVILLVTVLILSFVFGANTTSIKTVYDAIFNYNPQLDEHNILREIRIPRELGAVIVGMALAVSGAVMQGVTRNGLADPGLLGLNSGASMMLALTLAMIPHAGYFTLMVAGFIGAAVGGTLVMVVGSSKMGGFSPMRLVLAGAAVSAMLTAVSQGIALIFKLNQTLTFWSVGGVSGTNWKQLMISTPIILVVLIVLILLSRQLTILSLGDTLSKSLGQNSTIVRYISLIATMILAGIAVSIVGQIAFVGLMIPHIARFLIGTDYKRVIPLSALLGGLALLFADMIARILGEAPIGAMISIIGVPFFLYLVRKDGKIL
ncbi:iron ABC transporter permease [Mammaliicoccus sp. Dog046]|uniref:FecCD family ABC transporter permease n=1 Tax=Mammaliicoccus sp. Dog046 TaxID=3034233 RepID=UPI002B26179A|nr:iron ABC transporter permease [Mammaliicoccus sp. Dog046]WQK85826.1 iron ABC transporter permease [Mammaliicoccus sp. Dog046]